MTNNDIKEYYYEVLHNKHLLNTKDFERYVEEHGLDFLKLDNKEILIPNYNK